VKGIARVLVRIIADDLTGAADAAAPFARSGLSATVCLQPGPPPAGVAVVSVVTDSRRCPAATSAATVARAVAHFPERAGAVCFKKIDSLLRGSVGAETAAALRAWGIAHAVVAPALPALGRTTVGGVQLVHGRPVSPSPDRRETAPTADLHKMMHGLPCTVYDAGTDADLDAVVERHWGTEVLWVGSAGLAAAIARRIGGCADVPALRPRADAVLIVSGSRTQVTSGQIAVLGAPDCGQDPQRARRALTQGGVAVLRAGTVAEWGALVEAAAQVAADCAILTGGDTALAVLKRQGVRRLDLLGEPWPGTSLGRDPASGRMVLTKSGSFGDDAALRAIVGWLRGEGS